MPSPLSGFTQAAASPISAQLGPRPPTPPRPSAIAPTPPPAAGPRTTTPPRAGARTGPAAPAVPPRRAPRRRQRPDPDIHFTGTQREHPAVARLECAGVVAQFEMRGDPLLAAARGARVGPRRHPVCGVPVPGPAQTACPTVERTPSATISVRQPTSRVTRPTCSVTASTRSPTRRHAHARAPSKAAAPASTATARSRSSSSVRGTADPTAGSDPPGHTNCCSCPNPARRSPRFTVRARPSRRGRGGRSPRPREG